MSGRDKWTPEEEAAFDERFPKPEPPEWKDELPKNGKKPNGKRKSKAKGIEATELNVRLYMEDSIELAGIVRLDTFSGSMILGRHVPRPGKTRGKFVPRAWGDVDTTMLIEHLQAAGFDKVRRTVIDHVIELQAFSASFSAARQCFEELPGWDGQQRLSRFLIDVCGITDDSKVNYLMAVSRAFFISIVARVFLPGCKVDTLLVLEGPQGGKKSSLLRIMAFNDRWFSDSLPHNLSSKDAKQHMQGKLIIEMSEIAQMDRTSNEALKAFLSSQEDKFRPPYGRREVAWPRQGVMVGTTNDDDYLRDITGNRRYWPVACGDVIDLDYARDNIFQLYAEALVAFRAGEHWWFDSGQDETVESEQAQRLIRDPWEEIAREKLRQLEHDATIRGDMFYEVVVQSTLSEWFNVAVEKQDSGVLKRVGKLLKLLGGLKMRIIENGVKRTVRRFRIGD